MSDAAVRFAEAIGYVGAGTAEFVLEGREFFFLELNGRIQVEHPVTEAVTGIDLVQWQLRIARRRARSTSTPRAARRCGRGAPLRRGSAHVPAAGGPHRAAAAARRRSASTPASPKATRSAPRYDPMIAKLIAHGATRDEALDRLAAALAETEVGGVTTNLPFLRWLVAHPGAARRRDDDRVPRRASAALGAAGRAAGPRLARRVPAQPAPAAARSRRRTSTRRRRTQHGRGDGAEHGRRADARHGDQGARSRRLNSQGRRSARRTGGDEDGDAAPLAVRRDGAGRARPGRRSCRGRRGAGRAGRVAPPSCSRLAGCGGALAAAVRASTASARISTGSFERTGSRRRSSSSARARPGLRRAARAVAGAPRRRGVRRDLPALREPAARPARARTTSSAPSAARSAISGVPTCRSCCSATPAAGGSRSRRRRS